MIGTLALCWFRCYSWYSSRCLVGCQACCGCNSSAVKGPMYHIVIVIWSTSRRVWTLQGKYRAANAHFRMSVRTRLSETNCASIAAATSSRVLCGIGQAHEMMRRVRDHVRVANEQCLERVFDWKDNRYDNFELKVPAKSKSGRGISAWHWNNAVKISVIFCCLILKNSALKSNCVSSESLTGKTTRRDIFADKSSYEKWFEWLNLVARI